MATTVNLVKGNIPGSGLVGFSWTTLFFGFFVPLFRGDWKWFIIMFIAACLTVGIVNFVLAFFYNRIYTRNMLESGYIPADDYSRHLLVQARLYNL